jgi:DNA polymerase-3 subunit gamma/tau
MSYIAMARKWRPKKFAEMIGQDHVATTIENAIKSDRIHHAYLFTGTRGVGKTTSARILAKTLNCTEGETWIPCDQCNSCNSITKGSSLDVLEVDGASNNSVENVRSLIDQVQYAPMHGKYRIIIIDEVHMLTKSAFNALLKTLEEPPAHAIFIFATTESNKVPQTILSRIQRFDFRRIGPKQIFERLEFICTQEGIAHDTDSLYLIAEQGDGSMRDALTLFDQVHAFAGQNFDLLGTREILGIPSAETFHELLDAIRLHDPSKAISFGPQLNEKGLEVSDFVEGLIKYLRNFFIIKTSSDIVESLGLNPADVEKMEELAADFDPGDILRLSRMASDLLSSLKSSPFPTVSLEMTLARMAYIDRIANLQKVLNLAGLTEGQSEKKKS